MIVGRFAPTPSGALHFGSLIAALGSFISAKSKGGKWLVRIEDIDKARTIKGADSEILRQLEACALFWDGEIVYQSRRIETYREAIASLGDLVYPCYCSRSDLEPFGGIHPQKCPAKNGEKSAALRLRVGDLPIGFNDKLCGYFEQNLRKEVGDFALFNALGEPTYHLAVTIDDQFSGVTQVVRGRDLLDSTPRQIYLQRLLNFRSIEYAHLPLALGADGQKLSKQNLAEPIDKSNAAQTLIKALNFLGYNPPRSLCEQTPIEIINWTLKEKS
ncbi:MAG: tRNA glutamyl-Q(34) synthetase GluQRS [Helicobacteraceae bacterium]|jgi:glutamyl-Q tRNA(Asp) synthetase|nr:tRNA glutamyl-Q(34) synthetase GluQRS [Helicobacteraceae bacterium]